LYKSDKISSDLITLPFCGTTVERNVSYNNALCTKWNVVLKAAPSVMSRGVGLNS